MERRSNCCQYQPSLEELLADEVMEPVLRSAGLGLHELREMMVETARRIEDRDRRSYAADEEDRSCAADGEE